MSICRDVYFSLVGRSTSGRPTYHVVILFYISRVFELVEKGPSGIVFLSFLNDLGLIVSVKEIAITLEKVGILKT